MNKPAQTKGVYQGAYQSMSDDEINRLVVARAANLTPGAKGIGRKMGTLQQEIFAAAGRAPLGVREALYAITFNSIDQTINAFAGLVARGALELSGDKFVAKLREANP